MSTDKQKFGLVYEAALQGTANDIISEASNLGSNNPYKGPTARSLFYEAAKRTPGKYGQYLFYSLGSGGNDFIDAYYTHFLNPEIPHKQLKMLKDVKPDNWEMNTRNYLGANKKWAKKMRDFPINTRCEITTQLLKKFLESRSESALMNEYYIDEVGLTPGSFGKKHYIYSLLPKNPDSRADAILLDIKEVYTEKNNRFFYSPFDHHGLRMIEASKIFADGMEERLGYCTHQGKQYWGRQIPSFSVKVKKFLDRDELSDFAYSVGSELGKGHRKGLKEQKHVELFEKDFRENFDRYYKISKLFTFEISLAFEAMRRKMQLYQDYKGW